MKKLITLFLVSLMCLTFSANSSAATIYWDFIPDGELDYLGEEELTGHIIGIDLPTNNYRISFEYLSGSVDIGPFDVDLNQFQLKGGYKVANGLYVNLAMIDGDLEDEASYDGVMLGLDLSTKLSKELLLEGSFALSLTGSVDYDYYGELDADLLSFKGKCTYFFTNNLGASIGYRKTIIEDEDDYEITISGMTLGVTYSF